MELDDTKKIMKMKLDYQQLPVPDEAKDKFRQELKMPARKRGTKK